MSYEGTFGESGYGAKAQAVLGQVRGARFQHEKNKRSEVTLAAPSTITPSTLLSLNRIANESAASRSR